MKRETIAAVKICACKNIHVVGFVDCPCPENEKAVEHIIRGVFLNKQSERSRSTYPKMFVHTRLNIQTCAGLPRTLLEKLWPTKDRANKSKGAWSVVTAHTEYTMAMRIESLTVAGVTLTGWPDHIINMLARLGYTVDNIRRAYSTWGKEDERAERPSES